MADSFAISVIVFVPMAIEAVRAPSNERVQRARGGIEPPDDVYPLMRIAYPAGFLLMITEGAARNGAPTPVFVSGAVGFVLAKALKRWAIAPLGPPWTFPVVVVPGDPPVARGPSQLKRHPHSLP